MHRLIWLALAGCLASPAAAQDSEGAPPPEAEAPDEPAEAAPDEPAEEGDFDTPEQRDREARMLFEAGRFAYERGDYDSALEHFQNAYDLSGRADLLFNIGRVADNLRRDEVAIDAYARFLEEISEDHPARVEVSNRLRVLREIVARRRAGEDVQAEPAPEVMDPAPTPPPAPSDPIAGYVLLGVSGAVLAAGGIVGAVALVHRDEVENAPDGVRWDDIRGAASSAQGESIAAWILLAAGAVGLTTSIVLIATHDGEGDVEARIGPGSLLVRGTF